LRDADAAKRLFRNALSGLSHPQSRVINPDLAPVYGSAIADIKEERDPPQSVPSSTSPVFKQHYRTRPSRDQTASERQASVREFQAARLTIQGHEAMHIIRKGQVRWLSGSGVRRQNRFINKLFEVAG
jgi:transposase-like protein